MAILDNKRTRLADIYTNEADKALGTGNTGVKVVVNISTVLPLLVFEQSLITTKLVVSTPTAVTTNAAVLNTLGGQYQSGIDANNNPVYAERYVYITTANSVVTDTTVRLYYDYKYLDIIVVPETDYVNNGIDAGISYELNGYSVGSTTNNINTTNFVDTMSNPDVNIGVLPVPNSNIAISTDIIKLPGMSFGVNRDDANTRITVAPDNQIARKGNMFATIINLGLVNNLLVTPTSQLPLHNIYQVASTKYSTRYLGYKAVPANYNVGISLNF